MASDPYLSRIGFGSNRGLLIVTVLIQMVLTATLVETQIKVVWHIINGIQVFHENGRPVQQTLVAAWVCLDLSVQQQKTQTNTANATLSCELVFTERNSSKLESNVEKTKINYEEPEINFETTEINSEETEITFDSIEIISEETETISAVKFGDQMTSIEFDPSELAPHVATFILIQCFGIVFCLAHSIFLMFPLFAEKKWDVYHKYWILWINYLKIITVVSLVIIVITTGPAQLSLLISFWAEFVSLNEILLLLSKARYQQLLAIAESTKSQSATLTFQKQTEIGVTSSACWLFSIVIVQMINLLVLTFGIIEETGFDVMIMVVGGTFTVVCLYVMTLPLRAIWANTIEAKVRRLIRWSFVLKAITLLVVGQFVIQWIAIDKVQDVIELAKSTLKFVYLNGILLLLTRNLYTESKLEESETETTTGEQHNELLEGLSEPASGAANMGQSAAAPSLEAIELQEMRGLEAE